MIPASENPADFTRNGIIANHVANHLKSLITKKNKTMNIPEMTNYLKNECDNILSIAKNTNISESEFENYLKQPLKNFNEKFAGSKTTNEIQETLKDEITKIMGDFTAELTKIYLSKSL